MQNFTMSDVAKLDLPMLVCWSPVGRNLSSHTFIYYPCSSSNYAMGLVTKKKKKKMLSWET